MDKNHQNNLSQHAPKKKKKVWALSLSRCGVSLGLDRNINKFPISCNLQLFCVGFNSVLNLIVIMFNLMYPVLYVGFHCKGCV